jgi:putative hydrolase of the HAD superfamily
VGLPRALIFDLDDTLLDWSGMAAAVARTAELIAGIRTHVDARQLTAANASVWTTYWPEVESDWMLGVRTSEVVGREAWRRSLAACDIEDDELTEYARETFAREERASHRLYDDARDVIANLGEAYELAIVTNGARDSQRQKLRTVGIEAAFRVVIVSAEVGLAKPDPRIFDLALRQLGVSADAAWHIGDSLANDVAGAKAASLTAVWLNRSGTPRTSTDPEPDEEIRSLDQLLTLLGI